jgi:hypothetical protein
LTLHSPGRDEEEFLCGLWCARRPVRLDDPLLPIWVHKHHSSIFAGIPGKDLAKAWNIGADECSSVWVSSRAFRDAVLYRGVEPL